MELRSSPVSWQRARPGEVVQAATPAARSPWEIRDTDFPFGLAEREKLRFLLRYALLAPSPYNTQPWLFRLEGNSVAVLPDRRRALSCADPQERQMLMSTGALLAALRLAAQHFGYAAHAQVLPEPELLARVHLSPAPRRLAEERSLFLALPMRRGHVKAFDPAMPSAMLLDALVARAQAERATVRLLSSPEEKNAVCGIVAQAHSVCMADRAYRAELEHWIRPCTGDWTDGVPQDRELRLSALPDFGVPEWSGLVESGTWAEQHAAAWLSRAHSCPLLAVLATSGDTAADWVAAGDLLLQLELMARASGVWLAEFNQAVQLPQLRARLADTLDVTAHPQAIIGLGYGAEVPPLPRRPVDELILPEHSPVLAMH
jgi:nitroreductase